MASLSNYNTKKNHVPAAPYPPAPPTSRTILRPKEGILGEKERINRPHRDAGGATGNSSTRVQMQPSRARFSPSQRDLYACINCTQNDNHRQSNTVPGFRPKKKLGPILLELRRLETIKDISMRQKYGQLFASSTIALSRGNPQLGASVASTCLSFCPSGDTKFSQKEQEIICATGLTTGALCIHNFQYQQGIRPESTGDTVGNTEWNSTVDYFTPRHQRIASSVAWRPNNSSHIAIGLMSSSSSGSGGGGGIRGPPGARSAGGGDREFCCLVWDVEAQSPSVKGAAMAPNFKLSHNNGVASLSWLLDGQMLAAGSQFRTIQVYDLRVSGSSSPPMSTWAHSESVNGVEVDPNRPNILASFSQTSGEPIKIWDIRRMDSCLSEIKTAGSSHHHHRHQKQSSVSAGTDTVGSGYIPRNDSSSPPLAIPVVSSIRWSETDAGNLSVSVGNSVQRYDTVAGARPVLTNIMYAPGEIIDMAFHPKEGMPTTRPTCVSKEVEGQDYVAELHTHRMLAVMAGGEVHDMPIFSNCPLAVSRRDGRVVHAMGRRVWIGSTTEGASAMENLKFCQDEDISATMMRRARCLHKARYSMNASSNIQRLAEEQSLDSDKASLSAQSHREELLRLWSWIINVESLCDEREELLAENDTFWPAKGLTEAGVWNLLSMDSPDNKGSNSNIDIVTTSESLSCNTYDSTLRRAALTSCGWIGRFTLDDILADCESLDEFERSAALAVWHGDIGAAVDALQRGAEADRIHANKAIKPETLRLLSMCIAGYSGISNEKSKVSTVWQKACSNLLQRPDLNGDSSNVGGVAYIRGIITFLTNVGLDEVFEKVLYDEQLGLCDRVAFACRFLERRHLKTFLLNCVQKCQESGYLEGLIITGLTKQGIGILQSYVDRTADVQTACLVSSRVIMPVEWTVERNVCLEWLDSYRDLLNSWQMWQSRAMFDVDRAELLRHFKGKNVDDQGPVAARGGYYQGRRGPSGRRQAQPFPSSKNNDTADGALLPSIPAQLDARCNYCSMSLSGLRGPGVANQWLSKLKPVLSCCPRCRKPLPRCSICLLSMGCLNPYMELKRERSRPSRGGIGLSPVDIANLPFAEWFTWCMRCKHGGHAHHLGVWFSNHDVCPVSTCNCKCQFDAIKKLNRPALSK